MILDLRSNQNHKQALPARLFLAAFTNLESFFHPCFPIGFYFHPSSPAHHDRGVVAFFFTQLRPTPATLATIIEAPEHEGDLRVVPDSPAKTKLFEIHIQQSNLEGISRFSGMMPPQGMPCLLGLCGSTFVELKQWNVMCWYIPRAKILMSLTAKLPKDPKTIQITIQKCIIPRVTSIICLT